MKMVTLLVFHPKNLIKKSILLNFKPNFCVFLRMRVLWGYLNKRPNREQNVKEISKILCPNYYFRFLPWVTK